MDTNIKMKKRMWPQFVKGCVSQWIGGGKRYALSENKEFTDLVTEAVGNDWILGNIIKYCGEMINEKKQGHKIPEVNLFKIVSWSFIYWLKEAGNFTKRDKGEEF